MTTANFNIIQEWHILTNVEKNPTFFKKLLIWQRSTMDLMLVNNPDHNYSARSNYSDSLPFLSHYGHIHSCMSLGFHERPTQSRALFKDMWFSRVFLFFSN
ncbi:hypothetical protein GOODEAATRI_011563 [Goodea atripinnis]|uniref:Uncharacterized protein n=1 Tax=Goodea atripinnis TaxID=208336 RepID=A0ABV0NC66_9TELE